MKRSIVALLAAVIMLGSCAPYRNITGSSGEPPKSALPVNSSFSSETAPQNINAAAFSPGWVTYGKTNPGDLKGLLLVPEGKGPFPAVIFNHGSKQQPEPKRAVSGFFLEKGFVVFLPHRRGYGNSAGTALDEAVTLRLSSPEGRVQLIDRLRGESEDVLSALSYVKGLPFVDPRRIIMSGYSFGGITTVLASARTSDFVAGVVFATASGTWRLGGPYRQMIIEAAREAQMPFLLIYAENDYDLSPGIVLSREMRRAGKQVNLRIYPPFGDTEQEAHEIALRPEGIEIWGKDVMNFIERWMPGK